MAAGSSTLPNNETVTLKLPSGEMVDAVVPAGYSDDQVKLLMQMKRPDLIAPPGVPRPSLMGQPGTAAGSTMQQSLLGQQDNSDPDKARLNRAIDQYGTPMAPTPGDAFTGAALAGAAISPLPRAAIGVGKAALKAAPYVAASEGINLLRQKAGKLGKFIPSGAEMLPYFMMGGGEKPPASSESAAEAGASESRVPAGTFAKEVPNPDPYQFKGAPKSMDVQQSTNVGKTGYDADTRTMTVEYKSGQVYSYHGVPPEIYKQAQDADSVGSYISRNIKGRYETVRRGSVLVKKK